MQPSISVDVTGFIPGGLGWIPDLPDARDYTFRSCQVLPLLQELDQAEGASPDHVDLRSDDGGTYFTDSIDQGRTNCCTACAVLGLVEYFERRTRGLVFEGSRLFLYKVARNRIATHCGATADTGADLRTTFKAFAAFGSPPESYCPFDASKVNEEPSSFLYGLAKAPVGMRYLRLDEPNHSGLQVWETVRSFLAAGFPVAFGFSVPSSLNSGADIPYRPFADSIRGGQAVIAAGYRLNHFGRGHHAILIRSSWGRRWGDSGYGWLPAAFIRDKTAKDIWTVVSKQWIDKTELFRPTILAQT